jgi:UDP-2,3-diacylglucosamine hydrolase
MAVRQSPHGGAVFISDLHLSGGEPARLEAFAHLSRELAPHGVSALYILGDLFEAWPGDDARETSLGQAVADILRSLNNAGVRLYFMAGNRDFLLGREFAAPLGMEVLPDPSRVVAGGVPLVVSHGDLLCTDDAPYQAFRREVRSKGWQARFLAQPLAKREEIVTGLRAASESAKSTKSADIMDVNAGAVKEMLAEHPGHDLLHGHTHRPAHHQIDVGGSMRGRWVLPDWDPLADPPRGGGILATSGHLVPFGLSGLPERA